MDVFDRENVRGGGITSPTPIVIGAIKAQFSKLITRGDITYIKYELRMQNLKVPNDVSRIPSSRL